MRSATTDEEPLRSKYPGAFGDEKADTAVPKCTRLTIVAIFSDGSSRVVDFKEPDKMVSAMEHEPLPDITYDEIDNPIAHVGRTYFTLSIWPANKKDSVIEIKSPIPD